MVKVIDESVEELSKENRKELDFLHGEISKIKEKDGNDVTLVKNRKLKRRIARFFLKLADETANNELSIQETSGIISNFVQYHFEDDLDEVTSIATELELPSNHVSGNVFKMFAKMKSMLKEYK